MASGTTGFSLNDTEVKAAREIAAKFQKPASAGAAQADSTK
jgi:citrate lyase beta subunit